MSDRLWLKSEGLVTGDGTVDHGRHELLYGRAISTYFDVQAGYRVDLDSGPTRHWGAIGIQGLAPYWFEIALLGFVSDRGKPGARFEIETDWFLTQRLITRPTARIDWFASDDARRGIDAGFSTGEVGLRTRYEIRRKFAPYIDVRRVWEPGADDAEGWRFGAGIWLVW